MLGKGVAITVSLAGAVLGLFFALAEVLVAESALIGHPQVYGQLIGMVIFTVGVALYLRADIPG